MLEWEAREELCRVGREIHARSFVSANDGNFSYRLNEREVLATPTMFSKGALTPDDLVVVDMNGKKISGKQTPTSETIIHIGIMNQRPDIKCIIHAHPPHATAYAIAQKPVPKCVLPEVEIFIGEIPIADYATPGSQELTDSLKPYLQDFNVFLMANHGVLCVGRTIQEAHWRMDVTEAYCRILILALQIGDVTQFSARHLEEIFKIKERMGLPDRRIGHPELKPCDLPSPTPSNPSPTPATPPADDAALVDKITAAVMQRLNS